MLVRMTSAADRNQIRRAFDAIRQIAGINTYTNTAGVPISPPDTYGTITMIPGYTDGLRELRNITPEGAYTQAIVLGDGQELLAQMEQHWESQPGWDDGSSTGSSSDTSRPPQKTGLAPAAGKADIESGLPSDDSRNANVKDDDQEKKHNPNAGRKPA